MGEVYGAPRQLPAAGRKTVPMTATHARSIRTRLWRDGILESEDFPFEQLSDRLAEPDTLVWVDILCPDEAILETLADELDLDSHAVEDALGEHERPKAMRYSTHLFLAT